ncbi:hypothetical protein [uncultured Tenacibaculum sp.]|uniref:hypothetical protein n=1 Tax=uncultured Tenacibaculum sp. TaxID=174713 RepID=UPI00260D3574|nr:hypothetical protein [uncultured Tenacibaculum sp.]
MIRKIITALLLVNTFVVLQAQKLETKIPNNADVVIAANADNLFSLIDVSDIDSSFLGKGALRGANKKAKVNSVSDLGVDIKSNSYYFFKNTDSISYHTILVELTDKAQYEATLKERQQKKIKREKGYSYIEGYSSLTIWNDNILAVVNGSKSYSYFKEHKERFNKLKKEGESRYSFKKRIVKSWIKEEALKTLNSSPSNSIATNKNFQKGKKKNASATLWVRNYGMFMSSFIQEFGKKMRSTMSYLMPSKGKNIYGVEEVTANLFFEKANIRVLLEMSVSDYMKKSFKKIYNKRMNSALVNSFDHEKALAFWSMSINTEEMLVQYPVMMNNLYGSILPKFKQEFEIVGDVLSLVIDEEAIAKLVTGDALFVLNEFGKKEVEYTKYEYDEDYKRKEVTKTKETLVPDFTIMIGSEEKELLTKVFKLGEKYKAVKETNNVYELILKEAKLPFGFYAVVKNGVLYFTTSKANAISIESGKTNFANKKHNKLIRNNSTVLFADVNKIINKLPTEWFGKTEDKMASLSNEHIENLNFTVSRMKGNKISSELRLNTKGKEENTLKLLFRLIDNMAK